MSVMHTTESVTIIHQKKDQDGDFGFGHDRKRFLSVTIIHQKKDQDPTHSALPIVFLWSVTIIHQKKDQDHGGYIAQCPCREGVSYHHPLEEGLGPLTGIAYGVRSTGSVTIIHQKKDQDTPKIKDSPFFDIVSYHHPLEEGLGLSLLRNSRLEE